VKIDATLIDTHNFGYIASGTKRATLSGDYTPIRTGLYTLHIENTKAQASSTCIYSYIDNISLVPAEPNLATDKINVPCDIGARVNFMLDAGAAHGNKDYWIWMSASGTYPGIPLGTVTVPLNYDALFAFGLLYPGFAGSTGFIGVLDGQGQAKAALLLPTDPHQSLVGFPLYFAYVVTAPGPSKPVSFASYPVHVKYIP
jgi:hypothetical protein